MHRISMVHIKNFFFFWIYFLGVLRVGLFDHQCIIPGTANFLENSITSFFNLQTPSWESPFSWSQVLNCEDFLPANGWIYLTRSVALAKKSAIWTKSSSMAPLVVMAGDPILMPLGFWALLSPGTVFLLV